MAGRHAVFPSGPWLPGNDLLPATPALLDVRIITRRIVTIIPISRRQGRRRIIVIWIIRIVVKRPERRYDNPEPRMKTETAVMKFPAAIEMFASKTVATELSAIAEMPAFEMAMSALNVEMDFLSNEINASNPGGRPHENLRLQDLVRPVVAA